jgi:protein-disulfide isomerase
MRPSGCYLPFSSSAPDVMRFEKIATLVLVVCAVLVTGLAVRRHFSPVATRVGTPLTSDVVEWEQYGARGFRWGPPAAAVTIVEFSDFRCSHCAKFADTLEMFRARNPDVAVVYRHFPVARDDGLSRQLAAAAECARLVGRFESFHNLLFSLRDSVANHPIANLGHLAGISDTAAFAACSRGPEAVELVEQDLRAARTLQLRGTPSILVNGRVMPGVMSVGSLELVVQHARQNPVR